LGQAETEKVSILTLENVDQLEDAKDLSSKIELDLLVNCWKTWQSNKSHGNWDNQSIKTF